MELLVDSGTIDVEYDGPMYHNCIFDSREMYGKSPYYSSTRAYIINISLLLKSLNSHEYDVWNLALCKQHPDNYDNSPPGLILACQPVWIMQSYWSVIRNPTRGNWIEIVVPEMFSNSITANYDLTGILMRYPHLETTYFSSTGWYFKMHVVWLHPVKHIFFIKLRS